MGKIAKKMEAETMKDITPVPFHNDLFNKFGMRPDDFDPFGSYTGQPWSLAGIPEEMLEKPVQDADDL